MKSTRVGHGRMKLAVCGALLSATTIAAAAPGEASAAKLARLNSFKISEPVTLDRVLPSKVDPALSGATGRHQVLVRLRGESVASSGETVTREQVAAEQAAAIGRILAIAPSTEVVSSTQLALNAVVLSVDARDLPALARDTAITRVVPVINYRLDLPDTVPYIGAETAHDLGAKGKGIRVAVIDSGVDYTHAALGGPGTQAAYEAAWAPLPPANANPIPELTSGGYLVIDDPATNADNGLFPSKKVVGGYDYVGERWPNVPDLEPDADPIAAPDQTTNGGHGTHVADIIAGKLGVAPGAKIYAVKACSAPATSCSGTALIQSMDFALDPNGDGRIKDRVDIINMSLGSPYGQPFDDDLSAAVDAAAKVGVLTVASAGNSADKQFITGSPAAASSALSVAQTAVPSATLHMMSILNPPVGDRPAVFQPWSAELTTAIEGVAVYPPTTNGKRVGCADANGTNPYSAGELAGQIVLVDRGTCSFSLKISNIAAAGGILGIIGLITPEAPFAGAFGGGTPSIPGFMIYQADANVLRNNGAGGVTVRFDPAKAATLAGSLASTSSRGPRFDDNIVKPEIGAPGASVSAQSGSFTGTGAFGGTSGAAPMVSGAAAILMAARPHLKPHEVKQLLINTANPEVYQVTSPTSIVPDQLAPITRIGGGEVRVDRALLSPVIVSDVTGDKVSRVHGAMSFGYLDISKPSNTLVRKLRVENKTFFPQVYKVKPSLRYQDDKDTGAVTMSVHPSTVIVHPFGDAHVTVKLSIDGTKLRNNLMSSGSGGNAIGPLTANEYDGYVTFEGFHHKVSMPWHVLPRKSADVVAKLPHKRLPIDPKTGTGAIKLENKGVGNAQIFAYSLLATGTDRPRGDRGEQAPNPDIRAIGLNSYLVPPNYCGADADFVWEFAFNMFERKASPVGTFHQVNLDVDNDGLHDWEITNIDNAGYFQLSDGRQVVAAFDAVTGAGSVAFFVEHATNTSNVILRVCGSQLGLTPDHVGLPMTAHFFAQSWYFGGTAPVLGPYVISPLGEEFWDPTMAGLELPYKAKGDLPIQRFPLLPGLTPNKGVLLINNTDYGTASRGGATAATEALLLPR